MDAIQLLNTAIVKSKELKINDSYEERLKEVCASPALASLEKAINNLAQEANVSNDQAAQMIVGLVRDLESIWEDYVMMEGIDSIKNMLNSNH